MQLTAPAGGYEYGVVNRAAGAGFKVPAEGSELPIVFLGSFVWQQVAHQLTDVKDLDQPLKLKIERYELRSQDCPQWTERLRAFRSEITAFLENASQPFTADKDVTSIMVDGTSYMIQIEDRDGIVIAWPNSAMNTLAHQAASDLQVSVSKCANDATPKVLEYDF